jgi:hypothetical protein
MRYAGRMQVTERMRRWVVSGVVLVIGTVVAAALLSAPMVLEDTSRAGAVAHMPIPSSRDVHLEARRYAFWFGMRNAPRGVQLHLPRLSFDIVPPRGVPDPAFEESHGETGATDQGDTIRRVAFVHPSVAARYHISVTSPDELGGALLIGEAFPPGPPAVLPACIAFAVTVFLAALALFVQKRRAEKAS